MKEYVPGKRLMKCYEYVNTGCKENLALIWIQAIYPPLTFERKDVLKQHVLTHLYTV